MALETSYTQAPRPRSAAPADSPEEYWPLEKCKKAYLDYLGTKREEIEEQQDARRYRHGSQWTGRQVEIFNKRMQPVVTYNRIGRKIDAIVGLIEKLKQDPKAYPRNPVGTDEQGAQIATAALRYVIDAGLRESRFPFAVEHGAVDGIGGVEMMLVRGDKGDPDIGFALIQPDSFFYDPRSYDHDFADARYMGQGKWLDLEDAKSLVPEKADEIEAAMQSGADLSSSPDREKKWFDSEPGIRRVRVVEIWYKHRGTWCWGIFTGANKLLEGKSYFSDEKGEAICKYIMFSSFIDHDGDRYGFVRNLKSSQDEINQRRSKGLHELNSRRIVAEDGAFADVEVARREAVRPDGVVIKQKGFEAEFDDTARIANIEGQLKFLEDAKNEIENFGPNPALIGQGLEYKSGRAINLLQQAGIAELGPFVIAVKNWKLRLYRAIWSAVQRYWVAERWIRVTSDEGIAQFLQVNGVGLDPATGIPVLVNALGQLDVNIILDEGPDEVNMMADAYDTLTVLAGQGANIPPQILLELSPLQASVKRKLIALLEKPDPVQEQAKQIALAGEQAEVEKTKSETQLNLAKAQETAQGSAQEKMLDAQLKMGEHRMKQVEGANKIQLEREKAQIKLQSEFAKLQTGQMQARQKMAQSADQHSQQMRQSADQHAQGLAQGQDQHQQKLAQAKAAAAAKPKGGSNANAK